MAGYGDVFVDFPLTRAPHNPVPGHVGVVVKVRVELGDVAHCEELDVLVKLKLVAHCHVMHDLFDILVLPRFILGVAKD